MTTYTLATGEFAAHEKTLAASTADTVTVAGVWPYVEVSNLDGADEIYFSVDGSTPTAKGAATYVVPAAICARVVCVRSFGASNTTVVKVISEGTPRYSVSALVDKDV